MFYASTLTSTADKAKLGIALGQIGGFLLYETYIWYIKINAIQFNSILISVTILHSESSLPDVQLKILTM